MLLRILLVNGKILLMFETVLLCMGIFVTSVFWWPWAAVPFEVPKVVFFQWFVRALVLVFGASFILHKKAWKINSKLFLLILMFVVWATITSILGVDITKSFAGNFYRADGLITLY